MTLPVIPREGVESEDEADDPLIAHDERVIPREGVESFLRLPHVAGILRI